MEGKAFDKQVLDRYETAGNTLSLHYLRYRKDGERWKVSLKAWPTLQFHFIENAENAFIPLSCSFISPGISGWNEFTLGLAGKGTITRIDEKTLITAIPSIEVIDITEGSIRRGDSRLSANEALSHLRNRRERIEALTEWMRAYNKTNNTAAEFSGQKAFEKYWKPILLPELCSAKKRPARYRTVEARWVRAEDVRWNTAYTALIFPEELRPLRDSGALLRDWEEAAPWIYLSYEWNSIIQTITQENCFVKVRK